MSSNSSVDRNTTSTNHLDPHYSFLHYLGSTDNTTDPVGNTNEHELDESWQHVRSYSSNDISKYADHDDQNVYNSINSGPDNNVGNTNNSNHMNSILSSSDSTSDDEDEPDIDSNKVTRLANTKLPSTMEDEDSATVTKSLTSSSTSFIMPKLTLRHLSLGLQNNSTNNSNNNRVPLLIIGRQNLNFFQNIPPKYRAIFQITTSYDPNDYLQYRGLVIVVQEVRELISLLNRVVTVCHGMPIILVYERENKIQLKNIVKSFMRKNLITLLYDPIELGNEAALLKMCQHLSKSIPNNGHAQDQLKKISNKFHIDDLQADSLDNHRDSSDPTPSKDKRFKFIFFIYNKWTLLITVGLGIGICIKYYHLDNYICSIATRIKSILLKNWRSLPIFGNNYDTVSDANGNAFENDNEISIDDKELMTTGKLKYCYHWFKKSVKKVNFLLKHWFNKNLNSVDDTITADLNDWKFDDTNKFLNLNIFY